MTTENRTYSIAGLKVLLSGGTTASAITRLPGFPVFEESPRGDADIIITTDRDIRPDTMKGVCLLHNYSVFGIDHYFSSFNGGYLFELKREGERVAAIVYDPAGSHVIMSGCDCGLSLKFAAWVAYSIVAVGKGVIPIHASSVIKDGTAVLFLGESGTGKSTHSRLWLRHIPDTYLLNDDCPLIYAGEGKPIVYGSPWSGKTDCYRQENAPLRAIVRLRQGPENNIRPLSRLSSIGAVYPSCPPLFAYDEELSVKMLGSVGRIVDSAPIYDLECRPDRDAAETAFKAIY